MFHEGRQIKLNLSEIEKGEKERREKRREERARYKRGRGSWKEKG